MVSGVILGGPTLRVRGDYLAIVTLGFGEIIRVLLENANKISPAAEFLGGSVGFYGLPKLTTFLIVYATAVLVIVHGHGFQDRNRGADHDGAEAVDAVHPKLEKIPEMVKRLTEKVEGRDI